jgi:multiple RNA-binding domain-containing protein 1
MASRIFIKGLPPTLTEADFRKHFSQISEITDAKILQNRRIGYVGYRTPEDAQKAVKYFNKSFIRMSKISVELARPPREANELAEHRQHEEIPTQARRMRKAKNSKVMARRMLRMIRRLKSS